jgi:hypothetical protein
MTEFVLGKIKFTWQGNWAVSTAYEKDDIVKYGGNTYVCITGHTSGSAIPDFYTDIAKWNVHVEGVTHKGDHADATYYKINDIVKSDQHQYICTTQHTSTATINLTNFTLYVQGGLVAAQAGKSGQFLSTDGTNTTWVDIVEAAPGALDTLNELAASLADDADFAGTMTTALAGKEPTLTAGTVAQYYRGDKTWQTLTVDPTMGGDMSGTASNAQIAAGAVDLVHMSADSVDSDQYVDGSIDNAHLADDAVTADKLANSINTEIAANTAKVTNATHTGDVTGATALTIAADAVDIAMLSATGTADATTFLRGDNAWAAAGSPAGACAFRVSKSSTQSSSQNATTTISWQTSIYDVGSDFDMANNRFDCPNAGTYYFHAKIATSFSFQNIEEWFRIYKSDSNGGNVAEVAYRQDEPINDSNARGRAQGWHMDIHGISVCAVGDRVYCVFKSEGDTKTIATGDSATMFEGYQLI